MNTFCDLPQTPIVPHVSDDEFPPLPSNNPIHSIKTFSSLPLAPKIPDISEDKFLPLQNISEVEFKNTFYDLPLPLIPIIKAPQSSPGNHVNGDVSSESSSSLFCLPSGTPVPRVSEDLMMTFSALPPAPPVPVVVLPP
jgi:hypothetical protein